MTFTSCNDDSSSDDSEVIYSSTQVKSFSLKADSNVLSALDSVFFSIDLVNAQIFNADSLPYGTPTNKLVLNITTDVCSKVELNVPLKNGGDTVVNYLTNSTDSIDFSNGPVRMHLVSYDGKAERDYTIKVNVHKIEPDSLYWNKTAMRKLPTNLASPLEQKTVKYNDKVYTLVSAGESVAEESGVCNYTLAITDNPYNDEWTIKGVSFGFTPQISSFAATDNALYILDANGLLYTSTDGATWGYVAEKWHAIYGGYANKVLGVKEDNGKYILVTHPNSSEITAPADFPIEGASQLCPLTSKWTLDPQVVMMGGRTASGEITNTVWGYDGKQWAKFSGNFPKALNKATMFNYQISQTDTLTWRTKELQVLIAMGGETASGLNDKVYVSRNSGLDWKEGDELLQLPEYIAPRYDAQAIVVNTVDSDADVAAARSRSSRAWIEYGDRPLPRWWMPVTNDILSRAVTPVTQWEVPYIYLFGGYDRNGKLFDTVWRGVINRLTFKPLQ